MLYNFFLRLALILQNEAQAGETVCHLLYIRFSAHIIDNVLGYFVVIHNSSLSFSLESCEIGLTSGRDVL